MSDLTYAHPRICSGWRSIATWLTRDVPPTANSAVVIPAVRLTSILLKNSNFSLDHNSEDHWQPRWKFLGGSAE
jgi:hypothetical protein